MKVIAIVVDDHCYAVVKLHEELCSVFCVEIKQLSAWSGLTDDELLEVQTFVAWLRTDESYDEMCLEDCLDAEYTWNVVEVEL